MAKRISKKKKESKFSAELVAIAIAAFLAIFLCWVFLPDVIKSCHFNQANTTISGFCGYSSFDSCASDSDCHEGGCSGQICVSKSSKPGFTTCEYQECYNAAAYGLACQCFEGKCQWR